MSASPEHPARAAAGGRRIPLWPLVLVTSLFLMWGVANSLNDVLIAHFKKAFQLSDLQSGLVQSAFYFGYFCCAIQAAVFMQKLGYKAAVVGGLVLYGCGALLFYPAAEAHAYGYFLAALFVIASGLAFLETSANPLIVVMGDPATAERRLNLAQSFNPLGVIAGVLIGRAYILSGIEHSEAALAGMSMAEQQAWFRAESAAVQGPYLVLAAVVLGWALLVLLTRFPAVARKPAAGEAGAGRPRDWLALLRRPFFLFGVAAQFFYVGAQVGVWSFTIRYGQLALPGTGEKTLAAWLTASLVIFMVGRFVATALMGVVQPARLMFIYALANVGLCAVVVTLPGMAGMVALVSVSFFMSLMFPTIFALALRGLGPLTKAGSALVVMAIVGGALTAALMGAVSDAAGMNIAMLVPLGCFAFIAAFSAAARRQPAS